ncbi:LysR family transcriptional regulator [Thauera sp. SDU_THAU2]|uniref:LysR family transcriptional regulator n=1 Tax=Thauera sp. SDU_THAU2 TaxID=3136633 RepID=UPI00311F51DE
MRNLNLDQLQTLIAIADLGTLAAAAQALHLSAPTVSLHVSELESRLGVTLVHRGRHQTRLTPAGSQLVSSGRRLLKQVEDDVDKVRRFAAGAEGKVRLGASAGVIANFLPDVLETLARRKPGIELELDVLGSRETMHALDAGILDIGIVALPQKTERQVEVSTWRSDPMVAFLPLDWDAPELVTPEWLAQRALISIKNGTQMHRLTAAWFGKAGFQPRVRVELGFPVAIKGLVAAGYGAAILPLERSDDAALHAKMQLRALSPSLVRHMGIVHRHLEPHDVAIREVLRALEEFSEAAIPTGK